MDKSRTAAYRLVPALNGNRYSFICGVTGAQLLTSQAYRDDSPEQELLLAWETEGRGHFNRCQKCGRWVFDVAYNPEVLECIECAAFEGVARFCKFCGARVSAESKTCRLCGKPLYYEGVEANDEKAKG